jgi:hypothetical protein
VRVAEEAHLGYGDLVFVGAKGALCFAVCHLEFFACGAVGGGV